MTGARQVHVNITLNVASLLKQYMRGSGCRAYMADMQLEAEAADRVLHHPKVIIEVLSDSTAALIHFRNLS